jgi:hypothetical protein
MQLIGIIKRVLPFFLTFAAGLFIASFFVSLPVPNFNEVRVNRSHRHGKVYRLKAENERLRQELRDLKEERFSSIENCGMGQGHGYGSGVGTAFSDMDLDVPPPPPPPAVKELKMKTVKIK